MSVHRGSCVVCGSFVAEKSFSLFTESLKQRFSRLIAARRCALADLKVISVACTQISVSDLI